jgi:hypothetical protein
MSYTDKHPDILVEIERCAGHAILGIAALQVQMRAGSARLGTDGDPLRRAADMLDDVIHDELQPMLVLARQALLSGIPQAARMVYGREIAAALRRPA